MRGGGRGWAERALLELGHVGEQAAVVEQLERRVGKHHWRVRLVEAIEANDLRRCVEEVCEGVYAFDLFSAEFTTALLAEVDYFYASKLPAARPNSMNNCADSVSKP